MERMEQMEQMKETKKVRKIFTIWEAEKEQDYLREMHKSGWKLVKVEGFCVYLFEKCEPEDVIYQLDYNKDGIENKEEYVKMFDDCGWEYMQDYMGYSYFRKAAAEAEGTEEIFSDNSSKLQMMERVYKGRMIPLLVLFICALVPGLIRSIFCKEYVISVFIGTVVFLYLVIFAMFAYKYAEYKKR